jgi:tetratricopeptide (TPR) repeat protein
VNLGHTLRKLRQWDAAIDCYQQALGLKPGQVRASGSGLVC